MQRYPRAQEPNLLLRSLSDEDYARLMPHFSDVRLHPRQTLIEPFKPIDRVYFLRGGVASVVSQLSEGSAVEIGLFGHDGMAPVTVLMGADSSPHEIFIQIDGGHDALAISAMVLQDLMSEHRSLRESLLRYAVAFLVQTANTAASNANHPIEQRLARWLLMCHDRLEGDELALTHEFVALMLGIRRSSVTVTMHVLEGMGAIRSTRGRVTIRSRDILTELAGETYGQAEEQYRQLIGPFPIF